jgi:hypothetical protein
MLRPALTTLLAAGAVLATAAPAHAETFTFYTGHLDATVEYSRTAHEKGGNSGSWQFTRDESEQFTTKLKAVLPMVSFAGGRLQPYGKGGHVETWTTGRTTRVVDDTWSGV